MKSLVELAGGDNGVITVGEYDPGTLRSLENQLGYYGGSVDAFRAAATPLPEDSQEAIDNAVVSVGRDRLSVADDLINAGLTYPLPNWFGITELSWYTDRDVGRAQISMEPGTRGERKLPNLVKNTLPIPLIMSDFSIGPRQQAQSQRVGTPFDVTLVEQSVRRVNEVIEELTVAGTVYGESVQFGGNTIYGLTNAPNANTWDFETNNDGWTTAGKTGAEILTDVLTGVDTLIADNKFGPYTLYIPTTYDNKLNEDFKAESGLTIRARLTQLSYNGRPLRIRVADYLPADTVVLKQDTSDVSNLIVGQQPSVVSWTDNPGWERYFAVIACVVPRMHSTQTLQSGIAIGTPA